MVLRRTAMSVGKSLDDAGSVMPRRPNRRAVRLATAAVAQRVWSAGACEAAGPCVGVALSAGVDKSRCSAAKSAAMAKSAARRWISVPSIRTSVSLDTPPTREISCMPPTRRTTPH